MRLIDADELKSLYSKEENVVRNRLFSVIDRTPECDEGRYKKLYEQVKWERDMLQNQLDDSVPIEFVKNWLNDYIIQNIRHEDECFLMVEKLIENITNE